MLNQFIARQLVETSCVYRHTVAKNRNAVANRSQLFQPVSDVNHSNIPLAQLTHDAEHLARLRLGQR